MRAVTSGCPQLGRMPGNSGEWWIHEGVYDDISHNHMVNSGFTMVCMVRYHNHTVNGGFRKVCMMIYHIIA